MGDKPEKPGSGWYDPMSSRTKTIMVVIAGAIVVGAVIASVVLGIPFF